MNVLDQAARISALNPSQSYIVQAPAGSGKTELLTQRILSLLSVAVQQPEEILAITFTRKAADEMRLRVMQALQLEASQKVIEKSEKLGWNLLKNPQRLQIMTIDAFCASIAKQMPITSRMGALPNVSNQPYALYQQAAEKTITYLLNQDDESIETLLLHFDNRQETVKDEIANMLGYRDQWLRLILTQEQEGLRETLEDNIEAIIQRNLREAKDHFPCALWEDLKPLLMFALSHINNPDLEAAFPSTLPQWQALANWLLTLDGTVRKRIDKNMGFPADKDKSYKIVKEEMKEWLLRLSEQTFLVDCLEKIRELPEPLYSDDQWNVLEALFKILPLASAQLLIEFQQQRCVDFSEIAQSALYALRSQDDPSDLLLKLDNKINHILVDEFQDTSLMQLELLEKLVSGWEDNDGRTLFLVGDPMQSIYRFRQAEVGLFLRAQQNGIGSIRLINLNLQMNFRSHANLIHWFNQHGMRFFSSHNHDAMGSVKYSPSKALNPSDDAQSVFYYASQDRRQQALQVAEQLKRLQADETIQSIALLVRARNHLTEITDVLIDQNIPYQAIELQSLSQRPIAQHLLALTRAYINLNDSIAWLAVLRGPLCGMSLEDITLLREPAKDKTVYEHLPERIRSVFHYYLSQKQRMSLAHTIQSIWMTLGGPAYAQQEQTLHDAQMFFDLLARCEEGGTLVDESAFIQQLESTFSQPVNNHSKIQVMTIHRAKGLEFDAVLIPGLERRPVASNKPLLLCDHQLFSPIHASKDETDPIYDYLRYLDSRKAEYEYQRLLYVAITRAKQQLHLFACIEDEKTEPSKGSFLSILWPTLSAEFLLNITEMPVETVNRVKSLTRLNPDWQWLKDLPLLLLDQALDISKGNHVSTDMCNTQRLREQAIGTVLHSALYHQKKNEMIWRMHLKELGIHDRVDEAVQIIKHGVEKSQSDKRGQWILNQSQADSEYAILARHEDKFSHIIIDKTFVDENNVRWIIDYKTSQPGNIPIEQFYKQAHAQHAEQLERYAAILAQLEKRPIKLGLYFPLFSGWVEWDY